MLELDDVNLDELAQALEDHSLEHSWWFDPRTGETEFWSAYDDLGLEHPEERDLLPIRTLPSRVGYEDMEDFIARVRDPRARDLLERAIAGRGAFRRFKDTLFEFPELREAWFSFHDARMRRRAIEWLLDEGLADEGAAQTALARHPDPELPVLSADAAAPRVRIGGVVMHVADARRAADFWGQALGYVPQDGQTAEDWTMLDPPDGAGPRLALDRSDRTHLDLYVDGAAAQQAEVERLVGLGAVRVDWTYPDDADFVVLADTEGNLFCVVDTTAG